MNADPMDVEAQKKIAAKVGSMAECIAIIDALMIIFHLTATVVSSTTLLTTIYPLHLLPFM